MTASFTESEHWLVAGWTMVHFLWVGGLIGLLAGASRQVIGSARPAARYVVALGWLAILTAAPAVIAYTVSVNSTPPVSRSGFDPVAWPDVLPREHPEPIHDPATARLPRPAQPTLLARATAVVAAAPRYLPWAWLIGAPLVFVTVATGLAGAERLGRQSRLLDNSAVSAICRRLAVSLNVTRRVAVGVCDRVTSPVLIGIFRPVILLPPAALMGWSVDQLEMVLLHELAHVRRWDSLVNLLQRVVESLLFFHPAVWLVSRWVRREREHCCDQVVLTYTRRPRAYAELLAAMASGGPNSLALVAMAEASVVTRIRHVLKAEREAMKLSHKLVGLLTCAFITTAILVGASAQQSAASKTRMSETISEPQPGLIRLPHNAPADSETLTAPKPSAPTAGVTVLEPAPSPPVPQDAVALRLVDPDGNPVEGANVALRARWKNGRPEFYCRRSEPQDLRSGPDGRVQLPWVWFQNQADAPAGIPVFVMHVGRELSGTVLIPKASGGRELALRLQPPCRVRFRLVSSELVEMGYPLIQAKGHILTQEYGVLPLFEQTKDQSPATGAPYEFEYLLPPGKYRTWFFGDADGRPETEQARITFEVQTSQAELDLGTIDLPPTRYSLLYGQSAPQFVDLRNLRTDAPLNLRKLAGKMVLICFLPTYSCTIDCLQNLQNAHKQNGLQVILIHPPGTRSPMLNDDPDIPLIEAVDGDALLHQGKSRMGATAAAYGINNSNMLFLIDRDGRLIQRIRMDRQLTKDVLNRALAADR